jgi:Glycosyltransferases, probably involved in cell wall biogenesis
MTSGEFKVSIIIPVYNAERFVRRAAESALGQAETGEALLVEDCSQDNSLAACKELVAENNGRARLIQHPDKKNHGAGSSRNLGIQNAKCDFIAFLDADDYYLPNRFAREKEIFCSDDSVDGVYGAHGVDLSGEGSGWWSASGHRSGLTRMDEGVAPGDLLVEMSPLGPRGAFLTNAIVARKRVFDKTGCLFSARQFGEDTLLWMQMAAAGKLVGGELSKAVAMRGVHAGNSIRRLSDSRRQTLEVVCEFERWAGEKGVLDVRARRAISRAKMRLGKSWGELFAHVWREPSLLSGAATWRTFFIWMCVRQFPEDPIAPGIFPRRRRAKQADEPEGRK